MSIITKITETVARFMPDRKPDPLIDKQGYLGKPLDRVDGTVKVTGEARFIAEHAFDDLAYAALVCSTIAKGRIVLIDASEAERSPGFIAAITHENAPRMKPPPLLNVVLMQRGSAASDLPVLQDDEVHWDGQPLAVVVAATHEQAQHAATLVRVEYEREPAAVSFERAKPDAFVPRDIIGEEAEVTIGDADQAFAAAEHTVDNVYRTPRLNPNALELHATIAAWDGDRVTLFDSTQFLNGVKHVIATMFDLALDHVRVLAPFVGGGFGGKFALWTNTALCVAAAKVTGRPVKLVLSRGDVFRAVGGRTLSEQRVALAANSEGRLTALIHTGTTATTTHARYAEHFSFASRHLYAADNFRIAQNAVHLDTVANSWMRAPGEAIGLFALESAVDELAHAMQIDPVELRKRNEPERDPTKTFEFSSRHLIEAYERGAERFGWSARNPQPRSRRDGKWLVGQGVASAYHPVIRFQARVRLRIAADGTATVEAAANEIGVGAATVQIQHAADRLGLPIDRIEFRYGDTALPDSPIVAGGSSQTISIAGAVQGAVEKAHKELLSLARRYENSPLAGAKFGDVEARDGGLFRIDDPAAGETYAAILTRAGQDVLEVEDMSALPLELRKYSMASHGAHFCEVRVHEESGEVRVARWLASFDCGRVLNPKTAISQLRGGIVMGIGMALSEETLFDERNGRIMNPTLAEYHVPVHLDVPPIEVLYLDIPDEHTPLGAHGVGELGITGVAAAVANAVFHATGIRVRDLPITLDKLL